jgi:biotin operon repressor
MSTRRPDPLAQVSDFDIRLLKLFRSVAECGGFSAAESVLGIGRSAISQQMSDLEQRLGLRLCQRGRAGFALTEEGREVYQSTQQLLAALESFRTEVNGLHQHLRGELNIGLTDNLVTVPPMRRASATAASEWTSGMWCLRMMICVSTPGSSSRPSTSTIRPTGPRAGVGQRVISTMTISPGSAAPASPVGTWMSVKTRRSKGTTYPSFAASSSNRPTTLA